MAKLTAQARAAIPSSQFAVPGRHYPIEDASHARAAESMVSRYGTPTQKAEVKSAVARKYPGMGGGADPKQKAMASAIRKRKKFTPPDPSDLGSG